MLRIAVTIKTEAEKHTLNTSSAEEATRFILRHAVPAGRCSVVLIYGDKDACLAGLSRV